MHQADGVILVYNPDAPSQDQQMGDWYDFFVRKNGLKDEQAMIFAHRIDISNGERFRPRKALQYAFCMRYIVSLTLTICHNTVLFVAPLFSKVSAALTTVESGQEMKQMFDNLLKDITSMNRKGRQTRDGRDIHVPKGHYEGEA